MKHVVVAAVACALGALPVRAQVEKEKNAEPAAARKRSYFDFRFDLPSDRELVATADRFFAAAPTRVDHEALLFGAGPGLLPAAPDSDGRSRTWPAAVLEQLRAGRAAHEKRYSAAPPPLAKLQKHAWRARLRDGRELFVLEFAGEPTSPNWYCFTICDREGKATKHVDRDARWQRCSDRDEPPPVQQVDLDGDGRMEIVFPRFEHNGTVQNDDLSEYFGLDRDGQLKSLLTLTTKSWLSVVSHEEAGYVRRALCHDGGRKLRVLVWHENPEVALPIVAIGALTIESQGPGTSYAILERAAILAGAESYLDL